jgi:phenylacetic acid degradation operon negative regulatory protein
MRCDGDPIAALLARFTARQPIRTGSLIITVFGDAILPRGGEVLLADLIALLARFGLNDSQVRTALSRLAAEGWLAAERLGRRSLYRLTEIGRHRFAEATRRIYGGPPERWRGEWHVAVLPPAARSELAKDLGWLGFGTLAPGVMLHPLADAQSLASVLGDLPAKQRPLVIAGKTAFGELPREGMAALVARCWDLEAVAAAYRQLLADFAGLRSAIGRGFAPEPLPALLARVMLIHDYRRIILRDPLLPRELLPRGWIGGEAYAAARAIYHALAPAAERWIDGHLHAREGALPRTGAAFRRRFP